ncbi:MAG: hypothetical protein WBM16_18010, partial [Pseudolabrys sp.]
PYSDFQLSAALREASSLYVELLEGHRRIDNIHSNNGLCHFLAEREEFEPSVPPRDCGADGFLAKNRYVVGCPASDFHPKRNFRTTGEAGKVLSSALLSRIFGGLGLR